MKQVNKILFIGITIILLLFIKNVEAGVELLREQKIAQIGIGTGQVDVYKIEDTSASTTCYVSRVGNWGSQSISCVR